MKRKKFKLSAIVFCLVVIAIASGIPSMAFALQWGDLQYAVVDGSVIIYGYTGTGGNVEIPATIDGMPVVSIGDYVFYNFPGLTSVTIPDSVTSIDESAFWECRNLTSIVVDPGNAVYSSQDGVLYKKDGTVLIFCPWGKAGAFVIPNSVRSIGNLAFYYCYRLTSVNIPNSVTSIGQFAFEYCGGLTSVTIPCSVTRIKDYAFLYCLALTKAYFFGTAPSMGTGVFAGCSSNFTVCYTNRSTGFSSPTWCPTYDQCYQAEMCVLVDSPCPCVKIYGENADETKLLREYRDKVLSKTTEGQAIINAYYKYSPTVAKLLEQKPLLRNKAKNFINCMLPEIRKKVEESNKDQQFLKMQ